MKDRSQDYMYLGIMHGMIFPQAQKDSRVYYDTLKRLVEDPYFTAVEVGFPPDGDYLRTKKTFVSFQALAYGIQPITLNERYDLADPDDKVRKIEISSGKEVRGPGREERKACSLTMRDLQVCGR